MYWNGVRHELNFDGIGYYTYPNRVGGTSLGLDLIDWIFSEMESCDTYLEIGTFDGVVLSLLAEKYPEKLFYAIDPFRRATNTGGGSQDYFWANNKPYENVHLYALTSQVALPRLISEEKKFDLIFIDGDHSYESTKNDLEFCSKMINPGGKIFCHDISMEGVIKATQEFSDTTNKERIQTSQSVFLFNF